MRSSKKLQADVELLNAIRQSVGDREVTLHLIDARPRLNAEANALKGKGYESVRHYSNTELHFMNIGELNSLRFLLLNMWTDNIHVMRESLTVLMKAVRLPNGDIIAALGNSQWLKHVSNVLRGAVFMANLLEQGHPLVCHCSDGWDRTSQLCALTQLLLDPFYRSMKGFALLIEKDWCAFGHRFKERCCLVDGRYVSPVFLQFLDAVFQILEQFPTAFEFNQYFLIALVDAVYSNTFNTFLGNNQQERIDLSERLVSGGVQVWGALSMPWFFNPLYKRSSKPVNYLKPLYSTSALKLWDTLYLRDSGLRSPELSIEQTWALKQHH